MATLVDSNVILDVLTSDVEWHDWSARWLRDCSGEGALFLNPIIHAELAASFPTEELLATYIDTSEYRRQNLPWEAAWLAGRAFVNYRRRGGARRSPLPDFYIGAHAQVAGLRLLTRDARRYREYFPEVKLIAPE